MPAWADGIEKGGGTDVISIRSSPNDIRLVVPDEVEKSTTVRVQLVTQDAQGLYTPATTPQIRVEDDAGTEEVAFTNMTQHATLGAGVYFYDWASGTVLEGKKFQAKWTRVVEGVTRTYYATGETVVVEEKTDLDDIQAKTTTLHDTRIPGIVQPQTGDSFARLAAPAGASVSADIAAVKTETAALLVDTGDGTDAVVAAGVAGSLHGHVRSAQVEVNKIGTPAGASVSADIAAVKTDSATILVDTGDGTDAAVAPGVAGSLHGHVREAQDDLDTTLARLTAARATNLDELGATNVPADIDTLLARLTALRAGYLDNLSAGAVALQSSVDDLEGRLTAARATNLDAALVTTGTHTHTAAGGTTEQEVTAVTTHKGLIQIVLDLSTLTEDVTARTYLRINAAWVLAKSELVTDPAAGTIKAWYSDAFIGNNGVRVTLKSSVAEAANRSVPFEVNRLMGA